MGDQQKNTQEPDVTQLRKVRREKLADLQANGKNPFEITKYDVTCHATDIKENFEEMEGKHVSVAGRVMQKRVMGKASFCNVQDLKAASRFMWQGTAWVRSLIRISRKWTSAISWV